MKPFVLVAVDDLMARSRVEVTARKLGYDVRAADTEIAFRDAVADGPALVLLGTPHRMLPWEALVAELGQSPGHPRVLAFGRHTDLATQERAKRVGVDRWVANSSIATHLPRLIAAMASGRPPDPR